jgi:hypothetical protein
MCAVALIDVLAAGPTFTSTWKSPDASGVSFAGKKVAALVISSDSNLRISGEEQLVRELEARGILGVATYRMMPGEEASSAERARPWFERARVDGVVSLRPVSAETEITYAPAVWSTTSYSTLWGYYGYGWTGVSSVSAKREWPDWTPSPDVIARQPQLPRSFKGGPGNPLGARALFLGPTYRIHGTNQPQTIGNAVFAGCYRLTNADVIDLYGRVAVGTKIVVRQKPTL